MSRETLKRLTLILILLFIVVAFYASDLGRQLTLDSIRAHLSQYQEDYRSQPGQTIVKYSLIYILTVAASLPGAGVLTLLGGAIFGLLWGTVIVSFISTIGATLALLISRSLLRDWAQRTWPKKWQEVDQGFKKEGDFYLITLRFIPIVPFFLTNLLMGLTPIGVFRYYWVSQLALLPSTLAYINAGQELSQIQKASDILSGSFLIALAVLGLLPWFAKWALKKARSRSTVQS